jgi:hypothetical protein
MVGLVVWVSATHLFPMARCVAVISGDGVSGSLMFYQVTITCFFPLPPCHPSFLGSRGSTNINWWTNSWFDAGLWSSIIRILRYIFWLFSRENMDYMFMSLEIFLKVLLALVGFSILLEEITAPLKMKNEWSGI